MGLIFATTSGKGGVGKSTFATGLSFAFSSFGKKVLLVDMDEGLRCLDLLLGLDDSAVLDLSDALESEDIEQCTYPLRNGALNLIPAPSKLGCITPEKLTQFSKKAAELYDVVIFDFPAGLNFTLYEALPKKTLFLTVASPDPVCVRDASAVSNELARLNLNSRLIINRFNLKESLKRKYKGIDGIIDYSGLRLLGIVPEDRQLNRLSVKHKIKPKSKAMRAFVRIAHRLEDKELPLPKLKRI